MSTWTLRDMDNRDDDGAPWETTGAPEELATYLNGPVRGDLSESADASDLDDLIAAFHANDLPLAQSLGRAFGIYVSNAGGDES